MKIAQLIYDYIHYDEEMLNNMHILFAIITWLLWFIGACYYDYWLKDFFNYFHISNGFAFIIWTFICFALWIIIPCVLTCPLSKLVDFLIDHKII